MAIQLVARSLGEFFEKINIAEMYFSDLIKNYKKSLSLKDGEDEFFSPVLWFRGQENHNWCLTPSILRPFKQSNYDREVVLNQEQLRIQHFSAKNAHQITKTPQNRVEWLELMQHFGTKTRLLDWSESSIYSLLFSVEPLINPSKCKRCNLSNFSPALYVCSPQYFNMKIAQEFISKDDLLNVLDDHPLLKKHSKPVDFLKKTISDHIKLMNDSAPEHLNFIYDLSEIINDLKSESALGFDVNDQYYSLYYNLLLKYYFNGYNKEISGNYLSDTLLPLCVVQPYHSERIRAQRGSFMVFPTYGNYDTYNNVYLNNQEAFVQIKIERPDIIVKELSLNGIHRSWLYPEMEIVSGEIEKV